MLHMLANAAFVNKPIRNDEMEMRIHLAEKKGCLRTHDLRELEAILRTDCECEHTCLQDFVEDWPTSVENLRLLASNIHEYPKRYEFRVGLFYAKNPYECYAADSMKPVKSKVFSIRKAGAR